MGTKWNDACLDKVLDNEPIFVLRAQDTLAPIVVHVWVSLAQSHGCPPEKIAAALACADAMENWPTRKLPD